MIRLYADKNKLAALAKELITSGSQNANTVQFEFSPDWDGLTKTAVFKAGSDSFSVLLTEPECRIPWEVLVTPGRTLYAGIYGTRGGELVLPTIWVSLGEIQEGTKIGEDAKAPTPGVYEQIIGELANKADGMEYDGLNLSLMAGQEVLKTVQIEGGEGGGVPGPQGPPGADGTPGTDGISPHVGENGNWYVGTDDTGIKAQGPIGPQGNPGTDGNPIGTIISFMGMSAPDGYLVCDGAVYDISAYPKLANFINAQFGSFGYFGGDGTTTFAVPDMRNLFVRGFHGGAEEQLSGNIGVKQPATSTPSFYSSNTVGYAALTVNRNSPEENVLITNPDSQTPASTLYEIKTNYSMPLSGENIGKSYTTRPVNMSVLFCIKAYSPGNNRGDEYSTEEIPVGTWIDGKTIYRKVIQTSSGQKSTWVTISTISNVFKLIQLSATITHATSGRITQIPDSGAYVGCTESTGNIDLYTSNPDYVKQPITLIVEYTKTTD